MNNRKIARRRWWTRLRRLFWAAPRQCVEEEDRIRITGHDCRTKDLRKLPSVTVEKRRGRPTVTRITKPLWVESGAFFSIGHVDFTDPKKDEHDFQRNPDH